MEITMSGHDEILIRPYDATDWPAVCRIHDAARVQELSTGGVDARAFRPMVDVAEADGFIDSVTAVACVKGAVVGFVSWNVDYLSWLYVDPAAQRLGIGGRLLDHALGHIGPGAWTNMIAGNEPALALYRRAGLEIVWTRPGDCDGYPCQSVRLALPTSRMRNPDAKRSPRPI